MTYQKPLIEADIRRVLMIYYRIIINYSPITEREKECYGNALEQSIQLNEHLNCID